MNNEYIKTFPDVMSGKKILYAHGFASSGLSGTAALIQTLLPNSQVVAPDLPVHPQEAVALLHELCDSEQPDLIIGSSMGGMMAEQMHGYDRVLVNPAFRMGDTMGSHGMTGKVAFRSQRRDGVQEMLITKATVKEYKETTEQCFRYDDGDVIPEEEQCRVWGMFGDEDTTVDTKDLFLSYYKQCIPFHGGHRLTDSIVLHSLIPVIRRIDDRQENRQREVVYIDVDTLHDRNMNAASSMLKAIEELIEKYDVFFVACSPTNNTDYYKSVTVWTQQFVGVPAHDRVIFANKPQLLYGDYHITRNKSNDSMSTVIEYGSQQFKTWEDIITFFERLRGK